MEADRRSFDGIEGVAQPEGTGVPKQRPQDGGAVPVRRLSCDGMWAVCAMADGQRTSTAASRLLFSAGTGLRHAPPGRFAALLALAAAALLAAAPPLSPEARAQEAAMVAIADEEGGGPPAPRLVAVTRVDAPVTWFPDLPTHAGSGAAIGQRHRVSADAATSRTPDWTVRPVIASGEVDGGSGDRVTCLTGGIAQPLEAGGVNAAGTGEMASGTTPARERDGVDTALATLRPYLRAHLSRRTVVWAPTGAGTGALMLPGTGGGGIHKDVDTHVSAIEREPEPHATVRW